MVDSPEVTGKHILSGPDKHGETLRFGGGSQRLDTAGISKQGVHIGPNAPERSQNMREHGAAFKGEQSFAGQPVGVQAGLQQHSRAYSGISQWLTRLWTSLLNRYRF
jgi:hypothetical protein